MKKIVIIIILVAVVVIAAGVYLLLSNLDALVAKAIEKNGSEVTQTSVSVSGVDISLREGRGSIKGLRVASPEGFQARYAFLLDDITVDFDIKSLREDPIIIEEIRIQAPVVNAEFTKTGASNIDELRKRVQEYAAGSKKEIGESGGPAKRIRIEQFIFEKGSIEIDASALELEERTVTLPEFRLSNVGGTSGAPPDKITKIILTAVAEQVASEVADSEIKKLIEEKLGGSITDKAKEYLKKIGN